MPKLSLAVDHTLGKEEALNRLKAKLEKARARFGEQVSDLEESWEGDTFHVSFSTYGMKVKSAVAVEDSTVRADIDLPFAAMMFKGKIEKEIRDSLERWLA